MKLTLRPLLEIQRSLYAMPRGWERFDAYVKTMTGGTDDLVLPLGLMNPMGKDHVPALIDAYLALGAERIAADAVAEAERRLPFGVGLQFALVVGDDLHGGWTHRTTSEMSRRIEKSAELARGWAVVPLWTSEPPSAARVREDTLATAARTAWMLVRGAPRTLGEILLQEGWVARFSGAAQWLDAEELAYSRAVLRPLLPATDLPTQLAALYGDEAARVLGHTPLGLSPRAGFAVALADAPLDFPARASDG
jgi:hypothetical protein